MTLSLCTIASNGLTPVNQVVTAASGASIGVHAVVSLKEQEFWTDLPVAGEVVILADPLNRGRRRLPRSGVKPPPLGVGMTARWPVRAKTILERFCLHQTTLSLYNNWVIINLSAW